jgi:hypothetical protein
MGNSETPPFQKSILEILKDTGIYVPIVIAFIAWVFGLAPEPFTVTTATLAILIASLLLAGRLSKITRRPSDPKAGNLIVVGEPRKAISFWSFAIDPLRKHSVYSYSYPLARRRLEILLIAGLLAFAIINTIRNFMDMRDEFLGLQDCFGSRSENGLICRHCRICAIRYPPKDRNRGKFTRPSD